MASKLNLDKLDLQIIHEMMANAEVSYADLGKKLFVSGGTIHVRIKKLEEAGIVKGTRLSVDLKQLGYDVIAFIGIYLEKSSLYDSVAPGTPQDPRDHTPQLHHWQLQHVRRNHLQGYQPAEICIARRITENKRDRKDRNIYFTRRELFKKRAGVYAIIILSPATHPLNHCPAY